MRTATHYLVVIALLMLPACDSGPGPNESPLASFNYTPENPRAGVAVDFTANASDPDGEISEYSWDFNSDGSQDASGPNPTHTFDEQGSFSVTLTVTDDRDGKDSATQTVSVEQQFTRVEITEVTVQDMPFTTDSGEGWDVSSGPDVYYAALNSSDEQLAVSSYFQNVGPEDLPLSFGNESFIIEDLMEEHRVFLVDSDTSNDDTIGGIAFTVDGLVGEYPETTTLEAGGIELDLALSWRE